MAGTIKNLVKPGTWLSSEPHSLSVETCRLHNLSAHAASRRRRTSPDFTRLRTDDSVGGDVSGRHTRSRFEHIALTATHRRRSRFNLLNCRDQKKRFHWRNCQYPYTCHSWHNPRHRYNQNFAAARENADKLLNDHHLAEIRRFAAMNLATCDFEADVQTLKQSQRRIDSVLKQS